MAKPTPRYKTKNGKKVFDGSTSTGGATPPSAAAATPPSSQKRRPPSRGYIHWKPVSTDTEIVQVNDYVRYERRTIHLEGRTSEGEDVTARGHAIQMEVFNTGTQTWLPIGVADTVYPNAEPGTRYNEQTIAEKFAAGDAADYYHNLTAEQLEEVHESTRKMEADIARWGSD